MLIDTAVINVKAGRGGDGCVSFRREKYIPKGGPDGGDGGDGGDVYLLAAAGVETLLDFSGRLNWEAGEGKPGQGSQCAGKDGADLEIKLPPGTLVYDAANGQLLVDLDVAGKQYCIAQGGKGGRGNEHFKTSTHQVPREAEPGRPGAERRLRLELKLIADVGLIGKPNAGKSTLLSCLSRARPKIADYPFTTLEPQLGIAELPGARRMVLADIPGLIAGAHQGAGLGIQFLRHVERTHLLVHLIEVEPSDGSDPVENYRLVRRELEAYAPALAAKREIVVVTKMDLLASEADRAAAMELLQTALGKPLLSISAATGWGLPAVLQQCWEALQEVKAQAAAQAAAAAAAQAQAQAQTQAQQ